MGLFPYALWARTVREVLAEASEQSLLREAAPTGSPRLRAALASYLHDVRGMEVDPSQIVVGAGAQMLYNLIVQLLGRDRRYAVENPGYPRLTHIYQVNDVPLSHVPLDRSGISMEGLRGSGASVAHVMPSHQYPTGLVTSVGRRYELLAWANEPCVGGRYIVEDDYDCEFRLAGQPIPALQSVDATGRVIYANTFAKSLGPAFRGRYIVEDDYDCEFRLAGQPIPALQSVDATGRVIYANTFAKSLGPAFRLGYMVLSPHLSREFEERLGFYSCTVSAIEQLALARFIERGDYERHVSRTRSHHRALRDNLVQALRGSSLGDRLVIQGADAGLHFLLGVRGVQGSDRGLAEKARRLGLVQALRGSSLGDRLVIQGADAGLHFLLGVRGVQGSDRGLAEKARRLGVMLAPLSGFAADGGAIGGDGGCRWFVMSYGGVEPERVAPAVEVLERVVGECG